MALIHTGDHRVSLCCMTVSQEKMPPPLPMTPPLTTHLYPSHRKQLRPVSTSLHTQFHTLLSCCAPPVLNAFYRHVSSRMCTANPLPPTRLTLLAGLGEVLSSGASTLLGIFSPPYFFQYIQQDTQRRHCMLGGPHEYHCADCMAVHSERENMWMEGH